MPFWERRSLQTLIFQGLQGFLSKRRKIEKIYVLTM
jgi:hypothetical protein